MVEVARRARGVRSNRVRRWLPWCAGLVALATPLASAGVAAAATLGNNPLPSASVNGRVRQLVYSGNTVYLVGDFTQATDGGSTVTRNHAAAINITTGHLLPWNPNANGNIYGVAVDATANVVYLGGAFSTIGGVKETKLAQVAADTGAVKTAWKNPVTGVVNALSLGNGLLYVGGRFTIVDKAARASAAAINTTTNTLDPSWQPAVVGGPLDAVKVASGRVYIGGNATSIDGSTQLSKMAAVDPTTGALDPTWIPTLAPFWEVFNIDVTSTAVYAAVGGPGGWLWAMTPSGATTWVDTVDGDLQAVTDVGGMIIGGGHFDNVCTNFYLGAHGDCTGVSYPRKKLFAVDTNGVLQAWDPEGDSALGVYALATDAAGDQIAAGGDFTAFHKHTVPQPHVALFPFN